MPSTRNIVQRSGATSRARLAGGESALLAAGWPQGADEPTLPHLKWGDVSWSRVRQDVTPGEAAGGSPCCCQPPSSHKPCRPRSMPKLRSQNPASKRRSFWQSSSLAQWELCEMILTAFDSPRAKCRTRADCFSRRDSPEKGSTRPARLCCTLETACYASSRILKARVALSGQTHITWSRRSPGSSRTLCPAADTLEANLDRAPGGFRNMPSGQALFLPLARPEGVSL